MSVAKGYLWLTIGRLVAAGLVPEPRIVAPDHPRLHIKVSTPEDVDRWAQHLGMPPGIYAPVGSMRGTAAEYGSTDFPPVPGWCGYTVLSVYCDVARAPVFDRPGVSR